jgi:hypothetical protein
MSEQAAAPADAGALSVDQAIQGLLDQRPDEAPASEPVQAVEPEEENDTPAEPTADAIEEEAPADPDAEEVEQVEPEAPAIDPPHSWDAEAKAEFAQLPRKAQEIILAREAQRDKAVFEAQARAAETVKRAEAEASTIGQYKAHLDQLLPRAQQVFAGKWEGIDWAAWAQQDPIAAFQGKQEYEAELGQLQQLQRAQQQTQQAQYAKFLEAEAQKLPQLAPDLADPEKGETRKAELQSFLNSVGFSNDTLRFADATQLSLAYDAMRYRQLQAKAKQAVTNTPVPARPTLKPAAAQPAPSKTRETERIKNRFAQTRSVDDAVALLLAGKA